MVLVVLESRESAAVREMFRVVVRVVVVVVVLVVVGVGVVVLGLINNVLQADLPSLVAAAQVVQVLGTQVTSVTWGQA